MRSQLATGVLLTRGRRCRIRMSRTHRRNVWVCGPRVCQKWESTSQRRYTGGVVFQHVPVPLKQAGSFRAAGSALGHLPDAWRIYALPDKKPVRVQHFLSPCVLCWSPRFLLLMVLASPAVPVPMRPHIIFDDVPATQPPKPLWEGGRCFSMHYIQDRVSGTEIVRKDGKEKRGI